MYAYSLLIFITVIVSAYGTIPFKWRDCSIDKSAQAIQVTSITAGPVPLVAPGPLHLTFSGKVLKPIPIFMIEFDMKRHGFLGTRITVPCVNGVGSCVFDGCSFVDSLLNSTRTSAQSVAQQALKMIESVNATLKCPIPVENINVQDYTINVPDLGPIAHVIGDGDYTVIVRTKVPGTGALLGCLSLDVSLGKQCTGLFCGIGRKRK
ncbi:ganglioside GM2 activator-like [Mytilus californianus]|uniref:ganglioside GM2 activator-like n=1 Tax=Mytilus californianus TaxID=6549 RepID=UPI002247CD69|nr:ganglioside GM2 activator-like [Mytilus californianus]